MGISSGSSCPNDELAGLVELMDAFQLFRHVTVHAPHMELNLASSNPGIRRETVKQYLNRIEIAQRVGAKTVTFHHGVPSPGVRVNKDEVARLIRHNVEFGKRAAERGEALGLQMGYENLGGPTAHIEREVMGEILHQIGSSLFGLNLDIGHVRLADSDPVGWIHDFGPQIKEVHAHGTYIRLDRSPPFITHSPLEMEDRFSFADIAAALTRTGFGGPIVFEIFAPDTERYPEFARRGARILAEALSKARNMMV